MEEEHLIGRACSGRRGPNVTILAKILMARTREGKRAFASCSI